MPRLRFRASTVVLSFVATLAVSGCGGADPPPASESPGLPAAAEADERGDAVIRGPIELIDGGRLPASRLAGRVVLVVNTASRCGFTPQFEALEELDDARRGDGLSVVGFPSDDFGQELDDADAVAEFCELNYGVGFPMAAPGPVTGPSAQPLFAAIAARPAPAGEEPDWNFTKYLLDRRGRLVARYPSWVEPDDPRITATMDRLLVEAGTV